MKCCICGLEFEGFGNNAEPIKEGRCCDKCNEYIVIPERMRLLAIKNFPGEKVEWKYY